MTLPQLGIHEPVRVCDGCYIKLKLEKATTSTAPIPPPKTATTATTTATTTTTASTSNNAVSTEEFDDDIKKAIELSLKEAEQQKSGFGNGYVTKAPAAVVPEPKHVVEEQDEDLAAAIAASLRDIEISKRDIPSHQQQHHHQQIQSKNELTPVEMENILLFSTLMDRVYASGGDISNDRQINQLYTQIGTLQPKLVSNLDEIIRKRNQFIEMHEKLNMAVKAYDRLLEERISSVSSNAYIPVQQYQQQPLYHQQQQQPVYPNSGDQYYQTSAPPQESYYQPPNDPYYQQHQANNQDMSNYYSAPPHYQQPPQDPHYPQQQHQQEQKKPVDDAPLIEL